MNHQEFQSLFSQNEELQIQAAQSFSRELIQRGMSIAVAEGATGGCFIDQITIPGATQIIHTGGVFYSSLSKIRLGVSKKTIQKDGEYSAPVSQEMARSMQRFSHADLTLATVGELSSNEPHISLTFLQGNKMWTRTNRFPVCANRIAMKHAITQWCFSLGHHFLHNNKELFFQDTFSFAPLVYKGNAVESGSQYATNQAMQLLQSYGLTITTVESCSAASIANHCTNTQGASAVFDSAWLAYDENVKARLGVPMEKMASGNVYSIEVAEAMADAGLSRSMADIAIATTGTMETMDTRPFHTDSIPGTVYVAIKARGHVAKKKRLQLDVTFGTTRAQLKLGLVEEVMHMLTDYVLEKYVDRKRNAQNERCAFFLRT